MISVFAPLRSRVSALTAQIMVSPFAVAYLLLGSSLGAFVLHLLFIGANYMANSGVLELPSCHPKRGPEANCKREQQLLQSS